VGRALSALFLGWSLGLLAPSARAGTEAIPSAPLSSAEMTRLWHGETVVRTQTLARGAAHYVGGVTYTIVDASADELPALLSSVETLKRVLPRTRGAIPVGSADGDELVQVTQGTALLQGTYTIRMHRGPRELRFWMDPHRSHDIADAWGFLRATPLEDGRALLTYGVLVDMGPGLLRDLFELRVRDLALSVADRVRGFVLQRNAAGRSATR
jgi:hypothetical protein